MPHRGLRTLHSSAAVLHTADTSSFRGKIKKYFLTHYVTYTVLVIAGVRLPHMYLPVYGCTLFCTCCKDMCVEIFPEKCSEK